MRVTSRRLHGVRKCSRSSDSSKKRQGDESHSFVNELLLAFVVA